MLRRIEIKVLVMFVESIEFLKIFRFSSQIFFVKFGKELLIFYWFLFASKSWDYLGSCFLVSVRVNYITTGINENDCGEDLFVCVFHTNTVNMDFCYSKCVFLIFFGKKLSILDLFIFSCSLRLFLLENQNGKTKKKLEIFFRGKYLSITYNWAI